MKKLYAILFVLIFTISLLPLSVSADSQPYEVWVGDYFDKPIPGYPTREFYFPDVNVPTSGYDIPTGYKLGFLVFHCGERTIGSETFSSNPIVKFMYVPDSVDSIHATISPFQWIGSNNYDTLLISTSGYSRPYNYSNGSWSASGGGNFVNPSRIYPHEKVFSVLPFYIDSEQIEQPLFSMSSVIDSTGTGYFKVSYSGTDSEYHQCNFYSCTYSDWLSWQSSNTINSVSVDIINIVRQTDLNEDYDSFFEHLPPYTAKDILDIFDSKERISPVYHAPKSKQLTGQPSPSIVVGYGKASQIVPAYASLDFTDWRDNASLGGVYGSTDIVVYAKCMREVPDLIHGGTKTETYFCFQRFDISSIFNQLYVPPAFITEPEDIHPPTEGSINDLENLAQYLSYLFRSSNDNDMTIYNNFMSKLSDDAPLYVLQGLNGWLPSLSSELDSVFSGLFSDFSIPTDDQINELKSDIESSENAYKAKFYWITQIRNEVYFVTTSVVNAGDDPVLFSAHPVVNHDDVVYDYGTIVFFDSTHVDKAIADKVKSVITVFCSLGLLFYIFRTLPSTIGNTPNE